MSDVGGIMSDTGDICVGMSPVVLIMSPTIFNVKKRASSRGARTATLCVSFGAYAAHRVRGCSVTSEILGSL